MKPILKKKVILVLTIIFISSFTIFKMAHHEAKVSDLVLANIEALSQAESGDLKIGCDNYSVVIKCQAVCTKCYSIWTASTGYGNCIGLRGRCTCGAYYN